LGLGRVVTLTPTQALGFVFAGWSGDADCSDGVVTMSTDRACTAQFNQAPPATLTVTKTGAGAGTVTSSPAGISCGSDCSQTYVNGTIVTLTPAPAAGSAFSGWTGNADCDDGIVTMFSARTCTARFETAISATDVLMGQEPTRFSITGASPERVFRFAARGGRSYCVEVTNTDDGRGGALVQADPSISVFADGAAVQLIEANDNLVTEPVGRFQSRACFVAPASTIPMDGRIRVSDKSPGTAYYVLRIVETTLWASWFFQGGDFNSFVLMRNTTDGSCSFTITWRDPSGTVVGSSGLQSVGAHGGVGLNSRSFVPAVSVNGTVAVAHDCSPEALIGQLTSLSGEQGINFDSALFQRRPW
jgi:hypothetical protein